MPARVPPASLVPLDRYLEISLVQARVAISRSFRCRNATVQASATKGFLGNESWRRPVAPNLDKGLQSSFREAHPFRCP
eukprot:746471-Hanusia_phi.AAC.1